MLKKRIMFNTKKVKLPNFDYMQIVYFTLFMCGVIIGCFTVSRSDGSFLEVPKAVLSSYLGTKSEIGFLRDFLNLFSIFFLMPFTVYLLGLCAIGAPFIYMCIAFFGVCCGFYISLIISSYASKGVAFAALAVIPGIALAITSFIKTCNAATKMSLTILSMLREGTGEKQKPISVISYSKSCLPQFLPVVFGAALNAGLFTLFGSLFGFI